MIIKLVGETSLNKLPKIIKEVTAEVQKKAGLDASKYTLKDAEIGVLFNVKGEKMLLSSEIQGVVEPFKVFVELDEKGDIKNKRDNEHESFLDEYSRALASGKELEYSEIESMFEDADLEVVESVDVFDIKEITYNLKGSDEKVIRYYRDEKLIGEFAFKQKEGC